MAREAEQLVARAWPQPFALSHLRYLADTGGDVQARAAELDRAAVSIRSRLALGVIEPGQTRSAEAEAGKLARFARLGPRRLAVAGS